MSKTKTIIAREKNTGKIKVYSGIKKIVESEDKRSWTLVKSKNNMILLFKAAWNIEEV